jgi:hypothetical protein
LYHHHGNPSAYLTIAARACSWYIEFVIWNLFGIWGLGFGIWDLSGGYMLDELIDRQMQLIDGLQKLGDYL